MEVLLQTCRRIFNPSISTDYLISCLSFPFSCSGSRKIELKSTFWITKLSACCFRCDSSSYPGEPTLSTLGYFGFVPLLKTVPTLHPAPTAGKLPPLSSLHLFPSSFCLSPLKLNLMMLFPPWHFHPSTSTEPHNPPPSLTLAVQTPLCSLSLLTRPELCSWSTSTFPLYTFL